MEDHLRSKPAPPRIAPYSPVEMTPHDPELGVVSVRHGVLTVDERSLPTRLPVVEAVALDDRVVVLYDPDSDPRGRGTFPNLAALDASGRELWVAPTAESTTGDCYTHIASVRPLLVHAWSGFLCT